MFEPAIILALTERGAATAKRIRAVLPNAEVHAYAPRVKECDQAFTDFGDHVRQLFNNGNTIIGICASGILIRVLAECINGKHVDPSVVAIAEDASAVVPLLGGHHGANELARNIASALNVTAAVTTATDTRWEVALDNPPKGWALSNTDGYKSFVARLLAGESCRLEGQADWLESSGLVFDDNAKLTLRVTEHVTSGEPDTLTFHPRRLAVGVGCERGASKEEVETLVRESLEAAELSPLAVAGVFSLVLKSDEPAIQTLGTTLNVPVRFYDAPTLEEMTPRLENPSSVVFQEVGCHGVAEAAALAAAGERGELVVAKRKSNRATCAIARAPEPICTEQTGTPRGHLSVVGLGPGKAEWRIPAADIALNNAAHLVGYDGYLRQLRAPGVGQTLHAYGLGEETERVDEALSLASRGHRVALICSGDPGVYAMASLVFERLEAALDPAWRRSEIVILPGVSAMHGAASLIGAPLGHDFCAISLSDLLTPWEVIEQRLEAAAKGDFVVALYNPASQRRRRGLARAMEILSAQRPPQTPVIIARQVGREDQSIRITTIAQLEQDSIDMMTLLIIGSSETRRLGTSHGEYVYTPRGYEFKTIREQSA